MQNEQQAAKPLERRIDMAVPMADIEKGVEQRLRKMARTVKMAGFRPGKVPFKMVQQHYGAQARSEVIGEAVEKAFGDAVREQNLRVAGYPRIEPRGGEDAAALQFSAVFEVYPEIRLNGVGGRAVERPRIEVGEAEVDKTVEVLRKQRTAYDKTERAAEQGDRVVIDFTGRLNGEVFQGGQASDYPVVLGEGRMLPEFENGIVGLKAGEGRTFDLTFPADYQVTHLAGKTVSFEVALKGVEAPRLPAVDAEFAKSLGIADGDVARMRAEVRANLESEVNKRIGARLKEQAMQALLDANPVDVPRALVDQEAESMAEAARQDLANRGADIKNMPIEANWFAAQAERRVKLGLIIAEVVKGHDLQARPEQVRALIDAQAQSYEQPEEVVRWYYSQPQRLAQIEALVIEDNVVNWVVANASTTDKAVSFDELMGNAS
ncbi:MAG: Trigger factor [Rhodocyclaceae bacterium]|nr:MAG: trigger factor [Rhodocyclaceae bacterium]MBE7422280.1 trigger factor [Zoogloeaceae bacterium]MBV6407503.1 Trigger factor [Rhodocyclaceae bacterium]MCK6384411.1 trigger factor [Rhodocyclaceae bacterium]CAG0944481.1 Trigger factor [Gammaproteobacteria bacterium]